MLPPLLDIIETPLNDSCELNFGISNCSKNDSNDDFTIDFTTNLSAKNLIELVLF